MKNGFTATGIVLVLLLFGLIASIASLPITTRSEVDIIVEDKERVRKGTIDKYLIFTDKGTFENSDCLLLGKFDSSDMYNDLKKTKKYRAKVYGLRIPIFSMYKNIYEIEEIE